MYAAKGARESMQIDAMMNARGQKARYAGPVRYNGVSPVITHGAKYWEKLEWCWCGIGYVRTDNPRVVPA